MSSPSIINSKYIQLRIITFYKKPSGASTDERRATITGDNGKTFKVGDVITFKGFKVPSVYRDWREIDGSYIVNGITVGNGLYVSVYYGGIQWSVGAANSTNFLAFPYLSSPSTVTSVNGVAIDIASGEWSVNFELTNTVTLKPNVAENPPIFINDPPTDPAVVAPSYEGPVTPTSPEPSRQPKDDGNKLATPAGQFDIDKFIANARFTPGTDKRANARGIAAFKAEAKKAAKQARLTTAQTKKLMDAVDKAIADGIAKASKKPLNKIKSNR